MPFKQFIHESWRDRWLRWIVVTTVILIALEVVGILRWFPRDQTVSPLHYTIYFGINLNGRWFGIFILPAVGLVALLTHALISRLVKHTMWRRMWMLLALMLNLFAFVDLAAVLYLVRHSFVS